MDINEIMLVAYNVIRREVTDFQRTTTDAELGNYVRGVVNLQSELFSIQQKKNYEDNLKDFEDQNIKYNNELKAYNEKDTENKKYMEDLNKELNYFKEQINANNNDYNNKKKDAYTMANNVLGRTTRAIPAWRQGL